MAHARAGVEVESTVDVEPADLLLEVYVHNGSGEGLRDVRIVPEIRSGEFAPDPSAKGIASLPRGHSGRASFALRPRGRAPSAVEVGATVSYVDARGSLQEVHTAGVRLDLALAALSQAVIGSDAFADRASRGFGHAFELSAAAPPANVLQIATRALEALPMVRVEEAIVTSGPGSRVSLFAVDPRGAGYFARLVAVPRRRGTALRVNLFSESETGLFAFHHRARAVLGAALRPG